MCHTRAFLRSRDTEQTLASISAILQRGVSPFSLTRRNKPIIELAIQKNDPRVAYLVANAAREIDRQEADRIVKEIAERSSSEIILRSHRGHDPTFANCLYAGIPYSGSPDRNFLRSFYPRSYEATEPWTLARHSAMGPKAAQVLFTVLLCARRIRPRLPPEMWFMIFEALIRADFPP